ncbi:cilia- and flagella-associated protein 157-like isoform X1 [Mytilus californianus]|uniref:cilia- and flagella-associated protein 157-like isoform X1 n=1 Tax=Mytilus californianus TaxID=6549 RepID=UPI002246B842|nr:cilia- and flagella-associated protein 157-like isoform X1 [Mytilus californianus]
MPPKKKKSGKKGKKSAKKSGRGSAKPPGEQLNELSKEYYLIQIRDLENRLVRYQKKCDELEVQKGAFESQKDYEIKNKEQIILWLEGKLNRSEDECNDLKDQLIGLEQTLESEKERLNAQIHQLRTEYQEKNDKLSAELTLTTGKLNALEEFRVQQDELNKKFAELEAKLNQKDLDHDKEIYDLERKAVIEKDRLKKEMVNRVNNVAAEFRKVSNKQMAETTKRTIRENVSIQAQLQKMSDKTMELIKENDEQKAVAKKYKQQIEMLETNEKELIKKNHSNQKLIRMLTEKCFNQENLIGELESVQTQNQHLSAELDLTSQQVESQRDEIQEMAKENELLEEDVKKVKDDHLSEKKNKLKLEKLINDVATALKIALRKTSPDEEPEGDGELNEIERRDNMLENLLILMNSAAAIGVGPQLGELGKQYKIRQRSASKMPGSEGGIKRGSGTGSLRQLPMSPVALHPGGTLPHYQLGDLGLIPRPKQHIPTSFEQMRVLSATTRLGNLKKVLTRSVAIQTVSAPKALFYADQLLARVPAATQNAMLHEGSIERITPPVVAPLGPIRTSSKMTSKVF